jgi:putative cell wall-binding protein
MSNFDNLSQEILTPYFETYSCELQELIVEYVQQLDPIEKKAYAIAKEHLKSSFNIVKSNGFNEWKNEKNKIHK